jgi:hypothetical protein
VLAVHGCVPPRAIWPGDGVLPALLDFARDRLPAMALGLRDKLTDTVTPLEGRAWPSVYERAPASQLDGLPGGADEWELVELSEAGAAAPLDARFFPAMALIRGLRVSSPRPRLGAAAAARQRGAATRRPGAGLGAGFAGAGRAEARDVGAVHGRPRRG